MEIEGDDGSKIELKDDSSETVFGRGSGFNTKDRTVSRSHVLFQLCKTENQTEPRVSFQVIGKNPLWVRVRVPSSEDGGEIIKVFRKLEKGEAVAGDQFCISCQSPIWFNLKRKNSESIDLSGIDPVKEFGFLVIGREFDVYPKQRIRNAKNWDWFLEETKQYSDEEEEDESSENKKQKRIKGKRKKGGGDNDDDDWSGESEDDKEAVAKIRKVEKSKYSTRSKDKGKRTDKDTGRKKASRQKKIVPVADEGDENDEEDETLGGFIVNDDDEEEAGESDEEEEFTDDDEELDD